MNNTNINERLKSIDIQQYNFEVEAMLKKASMTKSQYFEWLQLPYIDYTIALATGD